MSEGDTKGFYKQPKKYVCAPYPLTRTIKCIQVDEDMNYVCLLTSEEIYSQSFPIRSRRHLIIRIFSAFAIRFGILLVLDRLHEEKAWCSWEDGEVCLYDSCSLIPLPSYINLAAL